MIHRIVFFALFSFILNAFALDQTDSGNYAVVHRDGHITDFTFFVAHSEGQWNVEQRQPDGTWVSATCSRNCMLKESTTRDLARFFSENELNETRPSCVHNNAFAFCRQDAIFRPGEKEYTLVALMMTRPIQIQLKKLDSGWKDTQGRAQPDSDSRKALNGFGGWLLVTSDNDWPTKWQTQPDAIPHFSMADTITKGQPLYALTFFSNPKLNDHGDADISCDIELRKPDGSASFQQTDTTCFKGTLQGQPNYLYLSAPTIKFIGEQNDPNGVWQVNITLKDNIGHTNLPLKTSFILQ
ncbi:MAG: hypothetical protein KJ850_10000 [Gammaproteobacteria bacterium]|nr:hypothetical protein [Gammaproteobacteria bacterium]MBU1625361.1 hypothetical protein [Gammaproteobacteria bacterium]MBU1981621.1 hypothetical protein [Gammaproteobacteria bacterium]